STSRSLLLSYFFFNATSTTEIYTLSLHDALPISEGSDEVEQSISDYTNSHLLRFRNREVFYAKKIDKALKKFDLNEFGLCNECRSEEHTSELQSRENLVCRLLLEKKKKKKKTK